MAVNWRIVALAVLGGAILGACLAPVLAPPILGLFGFGVAGPVAGGFAAAMQAGIGAAVAAGSGFAVAQSVAMGGALPAVGFLAASAIGGGVGGIIAYIFGRRRPGGPSGNAPGGPPGGPPSGRPSGSPSGLLDRGLRYFSSITVRFTAGSRQRD